MNKAELESKHLAELHSLAAEAGISGYRMLRREDLIEKLFASASAPQGQAREERREKPAGRRPRERGGQPREAREEPVAPRPTGAAEPAPGPGRPKRRRRRRRWGRRKRVQVHDLLLSSAAGGRTIVYADSRDGCTELLREIGAELSGAKGPDPVALLVDPSPEELAAWRRDAPKAEIVAAGQARHADDAIAQAMRRAEGGEAVIVLIDSLSRFAEAFGGPEEARELFEAGASSAAGGTLTVVAAVERS